MPLIEILLIGIFVLCFIAIIHSYILYPQWAKYKARTSPQQFATFGRQDADLPHVSVLMSLFNEEKAIVTDMKETFNCESLQMVVAGDIAMDGSKIAMRDPYNHLWIWNRGSEQLVETALLSNNRCAFVSFFRKLIFSLY